jgi:arginyl-tRNA synthetase
MSALMIHQQLEQALQSLVNELYPDSLIEVQVDKAVNPQFGDYATTVALSLAKMQHQNPLTIAHLLADALRQQSDLQAVINQVTVITPGFINITIADQELLKTLIGFQQKPLRHPQQPGQGQTVMVEFSSPNIAKPFNVGHLRSTIIGDSIARVYEYLGYSILRDNHLGDWGTQYGKLAYAVEQWGDWAKIEANPIPELFALYVRINEETLKDDSLQEQARQYFKRLEQGDPEVRRIWQKLSDLSMVDFDRLYQKFNVHFDMMLGEAFYEPFLQQIIQQCIDAGLAKESQGAIVIFPPDPKLQDPPVMIRKSNGTSTYATRDLAGIWYRFNHFKLDKLIIEIGNEQEYYFRQIIAVSEQMGWINPGQLVHVGHGMLLGESGKKFSTRRGETVWLDQLVTEIESKALSIINQKSPDLDHVQKQDIAQSVAIGALKYNDLSQNRSSNIVFDKDKALSLEGNSAPYLQYTIARANSVLRQAGDWQSQVQISQQDLSASERSLLFMLIQFHQVVGEVANDYLPNHIATFLFQTAQKFNTFYQADPILTAAEPIRQRRLQLATAAVNVLSTGLGILGVNVPERM